MISNERLPLRALPIMVAVGILEIGTLWAPGIMIGETGTGAPLAMVLVFAMQIPAAMIIGHMMDLYPEDDLIGLAEKAFGRLISRPVVIAYVLFWIFRASLVARATTALTIEFLLPETPPWAIILTGAFVTTYVVINGIEPFTRVTAIAFPIYWGLITMILLFTIYRGDWQWILPPLSKGGGSVIRSGLITALHVQGLEISLLYGPAIVGKGRRWAYLALGTSLVGFSAFLAVLGALLNLGELSAFLVWPTIDLVQVINFPTILVERIDAAFIIVWMVAVSAVFALNQWAATQGLVRLFKVPSKPLYAAGIGLVAAVGAMVPPSFLWVEQVGFVILRWLTLGTVFILPIALYVTLRVRRRRESRGT